MSSRSVGSASVVAPAMSAVWSRLVDYAVLSKARLSLLVLAAALTGFLLGSRGSIETALLAHTLIGTALVAFGASALNQLLERDADARMVRTADRPLPTGRITPDEALFFGVAVSIVGAVYLYIAANPLSAAVASVTLVLYVFAYTPLKRVTPLCLTVGAAPGALPPLIGYAAAHGSLTYEAWLVALIVFFWQHPHFLAISWLHREDYARAGFAMVSVSDPDGSITARQVMARSLALLLVALLPAAVGVAGAWYAAAALLLNLAFLGAAIVMAIRRTRESARMLFVASIIYLPILFAVLILDRLSV